MVSDDVFCRCELSKCGCLGFDSEFKTDISRLISVSLTVADRLTRLTSPGNGFCHRSVPSFMY